MAQQQDTTVFVDDYADDPSQLPDRPLTFVERTYTRLYLAQTAEDGSLTDMYVYLHPNGLCVLGLAPANSLLAKLVSAHSGRHTGAAAASATPAAEGNVQEQGAEGTVEQQEAEVASSVGQAENGGAFSVKFNAKLLDIKANAKKKNQGTVLEAPSLVCRVTVGDTSIPVKSGIKGKLLEVNHRLESDPQLLVKRPNTDGFLAILAPKERDVPVMRETLLSVEAYMKLRGLTVEQLA